MNEDYEYTSAFEYEEEISYDAFWELIQQALKSNYFMPIQEYRDLCNAGKLEMKTFYGDDRDFTRYNPQNPMALENRLPRTHAADAFRKFVTRGKGKLFFTERSPISIYPHILDCCASVRQSLIMAFIELDDKMALPYFEKLLPIEDSKYNQELLKKALNKG
jgi:hypothetical protein